MARAFSKVKQRSADLFRLDTKQLEEQGLRTPSITFQPRQLPQLGGETDNVIGHLKVIEDWADGITTTTTEDQLSGASDSCEDESEPEGRALTNYCKI